MSYAKYLLEKLQKKKEYRFRNIQLIDGIRICCSIEYTPINEKKDKNNLLAKITTYFYMDKYREYCLFYEKLMETENEINEDMIDKFLNQLNVILQKLKYDKYNNELTIDRLDEPFEKCFLNEEYNCVVCYEPTTNQTMCFHRLCLQCWSKLKNLQCPICREDDIDIYYDASS